jgi:hypothetical protein
MELNPGHLPVPDLLQVLPTPVNAEAGDTLRVTCTHDAGLRQQLPQLSGLPPRYVVWGATAPATRCASAC